MGYVMVMASRRVHRSTAPTTQSEGAPAAEPPTAKPPTTMREFVDWLPEMPQFHVEIVNGRVIVSPRGNPRHSWMIGRLVRAFGPVADEHGWHEWPELDVCIAGTREPLIPDFALGPKDAPRWGDREIVSDGLIMVAEVVSPGSVREDREDKPGIYARGGVPILLIVDPEEEPMIISVHSGPSTSGYRTVTRAKVGEALHIPAPIDYVLDTSIFLDT